MMHELPPKMALVHYHKNKKDFLLCGNLTPYENPPPHHSHSLKKKCLQKKSKTKIDYYGICLSASHRSLSRVWITDYVKYKIHVRSCSIQKNYYDNELII